MDCTVCSLVFIKSYFRPIINVENTCFLNYYLFNITADVFLKFHDSVLDL